MICESINESLAVNYDRVIDGVVCNALHYDVTASFLLNIHVLRHLLSKCLLYLKIVRLPTLDYILQHLQVFVSQVFRVFSDHV
jgi:hypothetical protein